MLFGTARLTKEEMEESSPNPVVFSRNYGPRAGRGTYASIDHFLINKDMHSYSFRELRESSHRCARKLQVLTTDI